MGGFADTRAYSPVIDCAGAGGGSSYVGGVENRTTFSYGDNGNIIPWNTMQPTDKNGIVKFILSEYQNGVE